MSNNRVPPVLVFIGALALMMGILAWTVLGAYSTLHVVDSSGDAMESVELTSGGGYLLVHLNTDGGSVSAVTLIDSDGVVSERATHLTGASAAKFFIGGLEPSQGSWKVVAIDSNGEIVGTVEFEITRHGAWEDGIP